jgi:hypothetical protein
VSQKAAEKDETAGNLELVKLLHFTLVKFQIYSLLNLAKARFMPLFVSTTMELINIDYYCRNLKRICRNAASVI